MSNWMFWRGNHACVLPANFRYSSWACPECGKEWSFEKVYDVPQARCPSCGLPVTERYLPYGVCQNCYGTTDDPNWVRGRDDDR